MALFDPNFEHVSPQFRKSAEFSLPTEQSRKFTSGHLVRIVADLRIA